MRAFRVWGVAAVGVGGIAAAALMLNAGAAHDEPKAVAEAKGVPDRPDWNWDVRPILSQDCFGCHGKGTQKAGLRLDIEKSAKDELPEDKGKFAVVPGNPGKSELFKRIISSDVDYMMPTKDSHKTMSPTEIATVERWIKQGAKYEQHWAYIAPKETAPGGSPWDKQAVNPIDRYVYAQLKKQGMEPAPEADRETLINRVTLDLTGLPPTLQEVDAFVGDKSPGAYEKVVDRLLASRAYAERQANTWLDVARYADTNGGLFDQESAMQFPYRDWVITAFQRNIPYDQFVTWQLAGDKLPNPTREQILATSFLRAGMKDAEMGSIEEEYRTNYMMERTELVGKAFIGLTVGCAKCHDHKYDVITQADYYSIGGFFNSMQESGLTGGAGANLDWPTPTQSKNRAAAQQVVQAKLAAYQAALNAARSRDANQVNALPAAQRAAYVQNAITADTQAYYPFDQGVKGTFKSLIVDVGPLKAGAPDPIGVEKKMAMTRADFQISLQNKLIAEAQDRAAHPEKYAAIDAGRAADVAKLEAKLVAIGHATPLSTDRRPDFRTPFKGFDQADMSNALAGKPGQGGPPAHGPGGPGGKPGLDKAALKGPGFGPHGPGPHGPPGAPGAGGKPGMMHAGVMHAGMMHPGMMQKVSMAPTADGAKLGVPSAGAAPNVRGGVFGPGGGEGATRDPDAPRIARREIDKAFADIASLGFSDDRVSDSNRANDPILPVGLKNEQLLWSPSGIPGAQPGVLNNAQFIPGARGQGVLLHDTVGFVAKGVGDFERSQPYTLDFWIKLRTKDYVVDTAPQGPEAVILSDNALENATGYQLALNKGKLEYAIISSAPYDMIKISGQQELPRGRWIHITSTYDGSSKAAGMRLYLDGQPLATQVDQDHLTRSARARNLPRNSLFGGYFGLAFGTAFTKPELKDSGFDELRVITRALTPVEVAYLQNPNTLNGPADQVKARLVELAADKDPAVVKALADLTAARNAEQAVQSTIAQVPVAADSLRPRVNHILDRGVFNTYKAVVPTAAPTEVFPWTNKYPSNRLGLADWLFDAKNPLTARVYINRMWQGHFGNGIVTTVDDFGTQGSNPTNPELLDYLAVEFQRSGWDMKHMHKLMVMSATYRQSSVVTEDKLDKDPRNLYFDRGPRYRLAAEVLRDNALFVSGLLVDKPGGDAVFPYQPDLIWDGAAQGFVVYPYAVPAYEDHRRSMYTFVKRNQGPANMLVFDMPDRKAATVLRPTSNTPLQALVLLNDPQFLEAYRKLAERSIKSSPDQNQQLVTLFRLAARRHPNDREMGAMKAYLASETTRASQTPDEVTKLLAIGRTPSDPKLDPVKLTAMTVVAAGVMNSPDAYTLR